MMVLHKIEVLERKTQKKTVGISHGLFYFYVKILTSCDVHLNVHCPEAVSALYITSPVF